MKAFTFDRRTLMRLAQVTVVILLWMYDKQLATSLAGLFHARLPEMPLIPFSYLTLILALSIVAWMRWRKEPLSGIGLTVPNRWLLYFGQGFLLFLVSITFDIFVHPLINPIIQSFTGADPHLAERHFAAVRGNFGLFLYLLPFAWLFGGFGEETINRGFVMTRIAQILGKSRMAWISAALLQAVPFALAHTYQGAVGMVDVYMSGVISGFGTLIFRRNLWPAIIAHGLQDSLGFFALYMGIVHA
jgi:membrane protease YdiL (CAAX protease family)